MTFRPSRRQVLSTLLFSVASGFTAQAVSVPKALAHPYARTALMSNRLATFNPATDIQPLSSTRQNTYPLILVHGFAGFGNSQLNGTLRYWGGLTDIQQDLIDNGFVTETVSVGPFSSNWDRACELYAQIKGGTVDYGQAHASQYGHARYGRTFPGLYPEWGEVNPQTGQVNKIHLIGHSMGGQTVRALAQLLEQGSATEQAATPSDQLSPLFVGNKTGWIDSVTTLSTPHNGSSATDLSKYLLQQAFLSFLAAALADTQLVCYDFMLDQWGLARQQGESLTDFLARVKNSKFNTTTDAANTDLTPDGAASVVNGSVMAQPDIFYFSVGTLKTHSILVDNEQVPDLTMTPLFVPFSTFIGSHTKNQAGHVVIDSSWFPNDGLVSVNSMAGPTINTHDVIIPFNGTPVRGKWNNLGVMNKVDHLNIIGWGSQDMRPWYRNLAAFLASLPQ